MRAHGERLHYGVKIRLENVKFNNSFLSVAKVSEGKLRQSPAVTPLTRRKELSALHLEVNSCLRHSVEFYPQAFRLFDESQVAGGKVAEDAHDIDLDVPEAASFVYGMDCVTLKHKRDNRYL